MFGDSDTGICNLGGRLRVLSEPAQCQLFKLTSSSNDTSRRAPTPNGAGKTTTISILTTTLAPTEGCVRIAGYDAFSQPSAVRREVGIIFQRPSLDLNLTAEENIRLHTFLYGLYPFRPAFSWMPRTYRDQVRELANLLDIEKELFRPIKTLSGGMRRKLEVIRSLMHSPRVLFLDEPTLGLDPISRRNLWEYLVDERVRGGTTVFLTTHYLEEAEHADRICVLDHGQIVAYGTPAQLKGQLVQDYVLIDAADRVRLETELTRLGIGHSQDRRLVRIEVQSSEVHALLQQIQTPLTVVQTHTPTLEDAYLGIIRAGEVEA